MARLADIQAEMGRRAALEGARTTILTTAGAALGIPPHTVTIESLADLLAPAEASAALARSAELRGLLAEVVREHAINRVLMRQELAFLDHLMRELGAEPDTGYGALAAARPAHAAAAARRPPSEPSICRPDHDLELPRTADLAERPLPSSRLSTSPRTTSPTPTPSATRARRHARRRQPACT
jgi:hypothetical protein